MKEIFEAVEIEKITFDAVDIITDSCEDEATPMPM